MQAIKLLDTLSGVLGSLFNFCEFLYQQMKSILSISYKYKFNLLLQKQKRNTRLPGQANWVNGYPSSHIFFTGVIFFLERRKLPPKLHDYIVYFSQFEITPHLTLTDAFPRTWLLHLLLQLCFYIFYLNSYVIFVLHGIFGY